MKITKKTTRQGLKVKEVEIDTILVEDVAKAEIIATDDQGKINNTKQAAAVLSQVCTFDGQRLPMEEVLRLELPDFLLLARESGLSKLQDLVNKSSGSSEKDDSPATT